MDVQMRKSSTLAFWERLLRSMLGCHGLTSQLLDSFFRPVIHDVSGHSSD